MITVVSGIVVKIISSKDRNTPPEYTQARHIQYSFTVKNASNHPAANAIFYVRAPVRKTSTQLCKSLTATHSFTKKTDAVGNQVLEFLFEKIAPFGSKIVTVTVELMMAEHPVEMRTDTSIWLAAEPLIESAHASIQAIAGSFAQESPSVIARQAFQYTASHVRYAGYLSNERGALYALKNRAGDCTEFAYLFVALCRAAGIPSRPLGGYICRQDMQLRPAGYHNWAVFYDGNRWLAVDPQNNIYNVKPEQYVTMRIISTAVEDPEMRFDRFKVGSGDINIVMNDR